MKSKELLDSSEKKMLKLKKDLEDHILNIQLYVIRSTIQGEESPSSIRKELKKIRLDTLDNVDNLKQQLKEEEALKPQKALFVDNVQQRELLELELLDNDAYKQILRKKLLSDLYSLQENCTKIIEGTAKPTNFKQVNSCINNIVANNIIAKRIDYHIPGLKKLVNWVCKLLKRPLPYKSEARKFFEQLNNMNESNKKENVQEKPGISHTLK